MPVLAEKLVSGGSADVGTDCEADDDAVVLVALEEDHRASF